MGNPVLSLIRVGGWQYLKVMCSTSAGVSNDLIFQMSHWCILVVFRAEVLGVKKEYFPPSSD